MGHKLQLTEQDVRDLLSTLRFRITRLGNFIEKDDMTEDQVRRAEVARNRLSNLRNRILAAKAQNNQDN